MPMPPHPKISAAAAAAQTAFHEDVVTQVASAVETHDVVIVGMNLNPHVSDAKKDLDAAGVAYHYLEYGGYLSKWRPRLALKLWSGWPTFPQIFVRGTLIGGHSDLKAAMTDGTFKTLLAEERISA